MDSSTKIKTALVGLGRMGAGQSSRLQDVLPKGWLPLSHLESILELKNVDLEAICDVDNTLLQEKIKEYGIKKGYTDFKKLIDEIQPYFLSVATRTPGRSEIIKYACKNKVKAIYLEKPICNSIKECLDIIDIANKNSVALSYGVNRRYMNIYRKAKEIAWSGELGDIIEINIEHGYSSLLWTHPHSTDLILFFANTTDLTTIQGKCVFNDCDLSKQRLIVDEDPKLEYARFKFKNNISAIISKGAGVNTRIYCANGIITAHADGEWIEINRKENPNSSYFKRTDIIKIDQTESNTVIAYNELIKYSKGDGIQSISPDEIKTGLMMLLGIAWSSLNGSIEIVPSNIPIDFTVKGRTGSNFA